MTYSRFVIFKILILLINFAYSSNNFDWGWQEPILLYNGIWEKRTLESKNANNFQNTSIWYYKNKISPKQGERCPCLPTCSTFTLYSMNEYGFLKGFFMGMDRLFMRENIGMLKLEHYHEIERGLFNNKILKGGIYDTPEANNIFINKDWRSVNPYFYFRLERDECSKSTDK